MAAGGDAGVVDRDDIRVAELPKDLHLAVEAGPLRLTGERPFSQNLDRDFSPSCLLDRSEDHALPATVDFVDDVVSHERVRWRRREADRIAPRRLTGAGCGPGLAQGGFDHHGII